MPKSRDLKAKLRKKSRERAEDHLLVRLAKSKKKEHEESAKRHGGHQAAAIHEVAQRIQRREERPFKERPNEPDNFYARAHKPLSVTPQDKLLVQWNNLLNHTDLDKFTIVKPHKRKRSKKAA